MRIIIAIIDQYLNSDGSSFCFLLSAKQGKERHILARLPEEEMTSCGERCTPKPLSSSCNENAPSASSFDKTRTHDNGDFCNVNHPAEGTQLNNDDKICVVSHYYGCCEPKTKYDIPLPRILLAELFGTFLIVVMGCGSVCAGLTGAYLGIWQTAVVWGSAVTMAILATAEISGAHLNPAVTLAFWLVRPAAHDMTATKVVGYIVAQVLGGVLGGAINLLLYAGTIAAFERNNGITRGDENSILTAAAFGEYFPNPHHTIEFGGDHFQIDDVTPMQAVFVEGWGTFLLCVVIFSVTHERNPVLENSCTRTLVPFVIGMTISVLLALYAPLTQAGWNPARDFGPRLVAFWAGWDSVAIPGPRNGFWVYIVGPTIGGPLGAALTEFVLFGSALDVQLERLRKRQS